MSMSGGSLRARLTNRSNSTSMLVGVDRGDAQAVADGRVGRRPAALAEDARGPGELDEVVDGEEVRLVLQLPR